MTVVNSGENGRRGKQNQPFFYEEKQGNQVVSSEGI